MKAALCTRYGPPEVLEIHDVPDPVPRDNQLRIRIRATAVTASDVRVRGFKLPRWHPMGLMMGLVIGLNKPRNPILGMVVAGDVDATGKKVTRFKAGDAVFGFTVLSPLVMQFGTYAEYICLREDSVLVPKPASISYAEAAAVPYGGLMALHFLQMGGIEGAKTVLVYGASGAIGSAAVQIARAYGATVTGVCSTANLDRVRALGAAAVLDYTQTAALPGGQRYDLVFDAVGKLKTSPLKEASRAALTPGGQYISVDDRIAKLTTAHLQELARMIEAGHLTATIDRRYPLAQIVDAHRYVDAGHKKGSVVVTVD